MKPRSPGFTPGRLTLAREASGISKAELASSIGVTAAAVGTYERGERTPGPDVLDAISKHLGQPVEFFLRSDPPKRTNAVFYRSLRSAERVARLRAQAQMIFLWEALDYFRGLIDLPALDMPKVGQMPVNPYEITDSMIEAAARAARQHWNLGNGPVPNIVWLLEGSGAVVVRMDLSSDRMDALSEWRDEDGRPYVLLNSTKRNAFRSRADASHELGHLLLHRYVTQKQLEDKATFDLIEGQAWKFAQVFLLPSESFLKDVYSLSLDALRTLKPKWKVSIAFMLHRIHKLEIIPDEKYSNYRKYLAQRGWLTTEPFDIETVPEQPLLLKQLVDFLSAHNLHTAEQILQGLSVNPHLLEDLTQVEPGYFTNLKPTNIRFTPKRRVI